MSKVLGIRNFSEGLRYAIIEGDASNYSCLNLESEHFIKIPKGYNESQIYIWYKDEITRIIDKNPNITDIAIKHNENIPSRYSNLKRIMFMDCIASMVALDNHISVNYYVYNQLGCNKSCVKSFAENYCGKTSIHWDANIADAIVAAVKTLK